MFSRISRTVLFATVATLPLVPGHAALPGGGLTDWSKAAVDARLGPAFDELNPAAQEDRPLLFKPESKPANCAFANKINPFELGTHCRPDDDYWSEAGQVAYVPDDLKNDPGLDRIQVFAYYDHVFAISPRLDYGSGKPHPDPQTQEKNYAEMLGHPPRQPIAMVRNYGMLQNEALVIYQGGLLAVAGTQTSRADQDRPYPGLMFPKSKIPTAIAVTTENEFALIPVHDVETGRGQLAVVALEGKYLPFHTWPYMGLPNQGSFSDLKLLGYVDLPFAHPSSVAAASNGWWNGPSQTNNQTFGGIDLRDDGTRQSVHSSTEAGWVGIVATKGYAIVASRDEGKVAFVDLAPLINFVRESYLSSAESFAKTTSTRGPGPRDWPQAFSEAPKIAPRVAAVFDVVRPTAVLAGQVIDRWSQDFHKAYAASEDGTIHIFNTSTFMARFDYHRTAPLAEVGTFKVGRNPVSMAFLRFGADNLPLLPRGKDGVATNCDPLNNAFYVACRGDREIVAAVTFEGKGEVFRRIKDRRMGDPVAVSVAYRGNIVSVADFRGRKVLSFRIGTIVGRHGESYGAGEDGKAEFEFAGELPVAGHPFLINTANVN